jgi:hypothetical protein
MAIMKKEIILCLWIHQLPTPGDVSSATIRTSLERVNVLVSELKYKIK